MFWYRARTRVGYGCSRRVRGAPPLALANLTKEFACSRYVGLLIELGGNVTKHKVPVPALGDEKLLLTTV